jgi:hypothetical protein
MRRREFIAGLGGAVGTWPLTAGAQQRAIPVIAFIHLGSADAAAGYLAVFRKGLGETGYVEGRNVTVEPHWLEQWLGDAPCKRGKIRGGQGRFHERKDLWQEPSMMRDLSRWIWLSMRPGQASRPSASRLLRPRQVCARSRRCGHRPRQYPIVRRTSGPLGVRCG